MFIVSTHVNAYTFKENTQYCNAGQATGCYNLGNAYNFGRGVEQNKPKAIYWYKNPNPKPQTPNPKPQILSEIHFIILTHNYKCQQELI